MATTVKEKVKSIVKDTKESIDAMKSFELQLVNIVGESVSFVPTGLAPSETTIVEFEPYYRPEGISDEEYEVLVKLMRRLFDGTRKAVADPDTGEDSDTFVKEPLPPCSEKEKYLVLDSLLHRKRVLFQQLYNQGILTPDEIKKKINTMRTAKGDTSLEGKDSLFVRTLLTHLLRLETFIQKYVEAQECINLEDLIYGKLELDLDDDKIKELLKQFVFFLLQSTHPLKDYTKIKPTPPTFISRLQKNLLKERFPVFLQSYKDNKFPISPTIAKILEATDLDPNVMKQQILQAIELERKTLLKHLHDTIPPGDKFWKQVGDTDDLLRILDTFIDNQGSADEEIGRLNKEKEDLDAKLKICEQSKLALQAEKARFEARIQELEATLASRADTSAQLAQVRQEKADADADFTRRAATLQEQIRECTEQKAGLQQRIQELTAQNEALTAEIGPLRTKAQQLDTLQAETARNIADLQARHAAALAEEQARIQEKEDARVAAVAMTKKVKQDLTTNQLKLLQIESTLRNELAKVKAKDSAIAQLQAQLQEKENEIGRIRTDISGKNEEKRALDAQIAEGLATIEELRGNLGELQEQMNQQAEQKGLLLEERQGFLEQIEGLKEELRKEEKKVTDLTIERDACKEALKPLQSSASASTEELARLTRDLATMKGERDAALAQQQNLEADVASLRAQLSGAEEEKAAQQASLASQEARLRELQGTLESKEGEVRTESKRANDEKARANAAEAKVDEITQEKDALLLQSQNQLKDVSRELKATYDTSLAEAKGIFDSALEKEEAEKEKILGFVRSLQEWIDNGATSAITIPAELPETDAFSTLVEKLATPVVPASPSASPKATKEQQSVITCYLVFLASFLWQTHFPTPKVLPTQEPALERYQRQLKILNLFLSFFNGGMDLRSKSKSGFAQIPGLYKDIDPSREVNVIFRLLDLFYNLMRSMEDDPKKFLGYISFQDKDILDKLMKKIDLITTANGIKDTFLRITTDFFITREPQIAPELLLKFVVYDPSAKTIRIVEKATESEANPSNLNYAVLFYCYLVCIRDYLNHIKSSTVKCPIPTYLLKK